MISVWRTYNGEPILGQHSVKHDDKRRVCLEWSTRAHPGQQVPVPLNFRPTPIPDPTHQKRKIALQCMILQVFPRKDLA
jgi:hypothetical protein